MKIEHFALQVPDPVAMAEWYENHLAENPTKSADGDQLIMLRDPWGVCSAIGEKSVANDRELMNLAMTGWMSCLNVELR